ncbi:MAG: hypothetical protein AAF611_08265 [Bacteroidota bacterium]
MKKCFHILICGILPFFLWANGGPIDESTIKKVGDLKFINTPSVSVVNEDLTIKIEGDYAEVKVTYTLKNRYNFKEDIFYAFPIDFSFSQMEEVSGWKDEYVDFITFKKNGETLKKESQIDLQTNEGRTKKHWYFVKFDIKEKEEIQLEVHYKYKVGFVDFAYSKSFYPVFEKRTFIYDFSAAQYWGPPDATSMNISLDISAIDKLHGKILKMDGIDFTEGNGRYTFQTNDFDFKKATNLEIQYELKTYKTSAYLLKKATKKEQIQKMVASSRLEPKYTKENMVDQDFSTCWCAKPKDQNPTLTFEFEKNVDIASIVFTTGYLKSKETYYNNNRLKKVAITQYYTSYDATEKTFTYELDLEDIPHQEIDLNTFYDMVKYTDSGDMIKYTSKIEIKILETYKGKKFNDTCISEILFAGYRFDTN